MNIAGILPLLKPADWELQSEMVCRPLTDLGAHRMPWVTYGWDRPHTFEMLGRERAGAHTSTSLDATALTHLRQRAASWETINLKLGWFRKMRLVVCGDDFLAAERILDTEFMREGQRRLGAKMLAVGIPRRGMLMAFDGASSKDNLQRFCAAVAGQFHRGETPSITTTVFAVDDGKIIGHLDDGGFSDQVKAVIDEESAEDSLYVQAITFDKGAEKRALICAGGEPLDRLEAQIRHELASLVQKYGSATRAEIAIIPDLTPRTADVDAWLPKLATGLTGLAGELGAPHEVRVTYGKPN
jgi:hypothetical protein